MRAASQSTVLFCICALAACAPGDPTANEPPPVEETVIGDMVGTMGRARGVEATLQQDKQALDRALEAAEGQP